MYEVSFDVVFFGHPDQAEKFSLVCSDLERALALSSLLQKISSPEVSYNYIQIIPLKLDDHEKKN